MGVSSGIILGCHIVSSATFGNNVPHLSPLRRQPLSFSTAITRKRSLLCNRNSPYRSTTLVLSSTDDSGEVNDGDDLSSQAEALQDEQKKLSEAKKALSEAQSRQGIIERERDQLIEELAKSETKHQENVATILHDKELAISELEAAKSSFHQKLQQTVDEKFSTESKLVLVKQDAVELAVQVEKLAEIAFQQATSHILENAKMRILAAETTAAEAAHRVDEQISNATESTVSSIVEQSKDAIGKALDVAGKALDHVTKAVAIFSDSIDPVDEVISIKSENLKLQGTVNDLEYQLLSTRSEVDKLKADLDQVLVQVKVSELRANDAEKALFVFQKLNKDKASKDEQEISILLEKVKKDAGEQKEAASEAFKAELGSIKAAIDAVEKTSQSRENAYIKRCDSLRRSLRSSDATSKMWRQRAEMAESLFLRDEKDDDSIFVVNGGRIDLLTEDDSQKLKLLSCGPRREIPQWMARRIGTIRPKFPPKKVDISEALTSTVRHLDMPKPDEVWSIARQKPKQEDTLIEDGTEKEKIEKKREALERTLLQPNDVQWQKTAEPKKLEPGTGTGREIVFQGFNWESWRRQWYLELAPKAADLSKCGITSVWLPPPTESVAPQGYMPSDLYNLNSAYGSEEELKYCIEEMHSHNLLVLGDVVLNHRCAQKQSPNGVWNIYGGKLAWGPEAISCDDPNFQGRGNPSTGDIFHAAPNVDHSQDFVRRDIKEYLNWLRNYIGYDGWRLDFVRGFSGTYVKEYIEASNPAFAIGEYWDSLAYENGSLCYNQDSHRQRLVNWINATGGTSSAFDVTTKGILHSALHNQYWRLIDPQGKPTGVLGWWPSRAVTFLENHDTGSTQGHWPFPRDKLTQGYAYILTHPGTPVIFYDHFYDFGIREIITELIEARRRAGVHCRSSVKIFHANNEGYVAQVGDTLVMKLGHYDWNPSKQNNLDGSWQKFIDKGAEYQVWLRQ
ncbi:Alpha-amylase [Euphorbia peplus]|nr:Alpha-amylase [Euphorbia peplus]